jgi:glycerate 2-kinase
VLGIYLSDVVGDDLSSVASGPTCPDLSTFAQAVGTVPIDNISNPRPLLNLWLPVADIVRKYKFWERLPQVISDRLTAGLKDSTLETPKNGDPIFEKVCNILVGSADTSASAAESFLRSSAEKQFENVSIFTNSLSGEAREFGSQLIDFIATKITEMSTDRFALIGTGEFTVTLRGKGVGGRNQEMLLSFLISLARQQKQPNFALKDYNFAVVSCAFDGIEGNSPATGAMVDTTSADRVLQLFSEEELIKRLENNDSHAVFAAAGDALITGQTGTNVNDMVLILVEKKSVL